MLLSNRKESETERARRYLEETQRVRTELKKLKNIIFHLQCKKSHFPIFGNLSSKFVFTH